MAYYINQLTNKYNHYKYQYLDHMTAVIDLKENYWAFNTQLFLINDFSLPINSMVGDLELPYQQIKDLSFNLASDQSKAKDSVKENKNYCKIFNGSFNVDVSQNQYLKQNLNNTKISLMLNLAIDPQAVKAAGSDIPQDRLDGLIDETSEQKWSFELYYTNTYAINKSQDINNVYGYSLPTGNYCIPKIRPVKVSSNEFTNINKPISNLTSISSETKFQVLSAKVKFYYWTELETEVKTLESNLDIDHSLTNQIDVAFNNCTLFDYVNNKVVIDPMGIDGFYIPKFSHGYYELEINLLQDNNTNKLIIKNLFNFNNNINKPYVSIGHIVINDLNGFKEVMLND